MVSMKSSEQADVFRSYLVSSADYDGDLEIPTLHSSRLLPNKLIPFSHALRTKNFEQWVHFYEHDENFIRVWRQPRKYLSVLQKFYGVISPDFSLQRNMPLIMQAWSVYMGRSLANFWQNNGIEVIPNVRFNSPRTYDFTFSGLEQNANLAIGTLGCLKDKENRQYFINGLDAMMKRLRPKNLIVYGAAPKKIFERYEQRTNILQFPSRISLIHSKEVI